MKALRGLHLHFDPSSGIAGDMAVAALVDLGVPAAVVTSAVKAMGVRGLRVAFGKRKRGAFVGKSFEVTWPAPKSRAAPAKSLRAARLSVVRRAHEYEHEYGFPLHGRSAAKRQDGHQHEHAHEHGHAHAHEHDHDHEHTHDHEHDHHHDHRDYAEIKRLLKRARLDADARDLAGDIFARIAEVEAKLHGTKVDRVAFHEVGAYDSIADVVGLAAAISYLAPASIGSLPPVVGTGHVHTAHGAVPVPAPATAELLAGIPVIFDGDGELTTPTGAAILAAIVDTFGAPPPLTLRATGYGAGTKQLADRPNVLRAFVGDPLGTPDAAAAPEVVLLEANIDDMSGELVAPLTDALAEAGAVDVWSAPILMKKGRPAVQVSALAPPAAAAAVERAFFRNSTTLGLRRRRLERVVLARSFVKVATRYGAVRAKLAALDGEVLGAHPEFEDCRRLAARARVPVREVVSAAAAAARAWLAAQKGKGRR